MHLVTIQQDFFTEIITGPDLYHYVTQLGKKSQVKQLNIKQKRRKFNLKNISEETISAKKSGLSFGRDQMNIGTTVIKREISPFKPGFFVLRILVNETHIALIVSSFILS